MKLYFRLVKGEIVLGIYDDTIAVARKSLVFFFIIDTSGSMGGKKIGAVNHAIEELIPELKLLASENVESEIKIAVLEFSTKAKWITDEPVPIENFYWDYLTAKSLTNFPEAYRALSKKLSKTEFLKSSTGSFAPVLFLMSDGEPNDKISTEKELANLKNNPWFKNAVKVAVAIGNDADVSVLAEFTGSMESVLTVHTPEALMNVIQFVSITSSKISSQSICANDGEIDNIQTKQSTLNSYLNDWKNDHTKFEDEDIESDNW